MTGVELIQYYGNIVAALVISRACKSREHRNEHVRDKNRTIKGPNDKPICIIGVQLCGTASASITVAILQLMGLQPESLFFAPRFNDSNARPHAAPELAGARRR